MDVHTDLPISMSITVFKTAENWKQSIGPTIGYIHFLITYKRNNM